MDMTLPVADTVARLGAAALLGGLVGLERERLERAAGLRTHALVALSSALIMVVSAYGFSDVLAEGRPLVLDPSRIAAQVVSGIGFLGAGVIIFRKNAVRGLTTAASVWSVAGIGLACGGGLLTTAAIATGFMLVIQAGLRPLERKFFDHHYPRLITMRLQRGDGNLAAVEAEVARVGLRLRGLRLRPARRGNEDHLELEFNSLPPRRASDLLDALRGLDAVRSVTYAVGPPRASVQRVVGRGDADAEDDESNDD